PSMTLPTMPTMPTMPSQSGTSETDPVVTDPSSSVKTPLYGDANDDGAVNMKDVLLMRKYMAEMPVTISFENSDVDVSGTVNMKDVLAVRKFLAEIIDKLGPTA
ncbi:MAG: dockerin type I repeat-containing protein, partial [Clostridia bacterium]|nr:dockerin type I repeat-containing protein [Clostridia bacterium]